MQTIAVLQQKGGVGKTTLATNLAAAAHLAGRRTLVLDMDRQSSAYDWYCARVDGSKLDGLSVLKADKPLSPQKFKEISRGYDVIVCDGPPRVGDMTRSAAVAADIVLVPLRPGPLDWWATAETLQVLESANEIRQQLRRKPVRVVFVLNGTQRGSRILEEARAAVLSDLRKQGQLATVTIGSRVVFPNAMHTGESVLTFDPPRRVHSSVPSAAATEITELYRSLSTPKEAA